MSGWIKLEKDLRTDPRFMRMAKALRNADVTHERISPEKAATLVLGSLAQLWMYADSHIREDDTLDVGPTEVDELVGVEGFSKLMPVDWMEVLDTNRVRLPGFQEHNGTEAKKRALTQKRVAKHRVKIVTQERSNHSGSSNAGALPDQTRLDQTRPDQTRKSACEPDAHEVRQAIEGEYPKGTYGAQNWILAEKALGKLLDEGESPVDLANAARLYADQQRAKGSIGTQFIRSPEKFYGDGFWRGPFPLPKTKAETRLDSNVEVLNKFINGVQ